jgi:hypothetical protein
LPERFEKQYAFLDAHPEYVVCGCQMAGIGPAGEECRSWKWDCPLDDESIRHEMLTGCPFLHPGVMYQKKAVLAAGAYRPEFQHVEDYDLWFRLAQRGRLANLSDRLMHYRLHPHSVSATNAEVQAAKMKDVSRRYMFELGLVRSTDEFESFYRCANARKGVAGATLHDASNYACVMRRFIASLPRTPDNAAAIAGVRRSIRWNLQTLGRSAYCAVGGRLRLLGAAVRFDPSLRGFASVLKSGLLNVGGPGTS